MPHFAWRGIARLAPLISALLSCGSAAPPGTAATAPAGGANDGFVAYFVGACPPAATGWGPFGELQGRLALG